MFQVRSKIFQINCIIYPWFYGWFFSLVLTQPGISNEAFQRFKEKRSRPCQNILVVLFSENIFNVKNNKGLQQANTNEESYVVSREGNEVSGVRINRVYFFTRSSLRRQFMDYPKCAFTNKYIGVYISIYKDVCTYFLKNRTAIQYCTLLGIGTEYA